MDGRIVTERSTYRSVEGSQSDILEQHPAEVFGRLLAEAPVHKGDGPRFGELEFPRLWPDYQGDTYLVLSYGGIQEVLKNQHISSDIHKQGAELSVGRSLFGMDPPEHSVMRRLLMAGFTPAQVRRWEDTAIRPAVNAALESVAGQQRFDLVRQVIEIFPYQAFSKILGLPTDAGEWASDRAVDMVRAVSDPMAALRASAELGDYLLGFIEQRRAEPQDDFISVLLAATVEEGRSLETQEIVNFLRHLFLAGIETTVRTSGTLMVHLLSDPRHWEEVVADPGLAGNAIDEALRLDPPANYFPRMATADIAVEGVTIPAGSIVYVAITAANRDPSRWPNPDEFDLHRPPKPSLAFSAGPHTCIGMHVGRREMTVFVEQLAERMPDLRLDSDAPPPTLQSWMLRGPMNLRVLAASANQTDTAS
jgi:cytochrome P450